MTEAQERRNKASSRIPLETLVEICGNEPGIPSFEAETLDVSAQGMHLRTAYLPDQGAPLVCRFEDHGREIVVEGVVAWRKESAKGGDFGVAFTALDSRSVDALRSLVKTGEGSPDADGDAPNGSRVRLHIEGLGSPMKARVRSGGTQKIQVGSSLEFLKVGRKLEVEDLEAGGRRGAQIDGVEVVIDPRTSVPQLVVALRFEGASDDTPQPTVTDLDAQPVRAASLRIAPEAVTIDAADKSADEDPAPSGDVPEAKADADDGGSDLDDEDDDESYSDRALPATARAARRVGHAAENAGNAARDASIAAVRWGKGAMGGMGKLFAGASAKLGSLRAGDATPAKRRTTAKPVEAPASLDGQRLRPQSGKGAESSPPVAVPARKPKKSVAIGIALAAVAASAGVIALRPAKVASKAPAGDVVAAAGPGISAPGAATGQSPGSLSGATPTTPGTTLAGGLEPGAPVAPPGSPVTANVPLFGPTPLATVEPAPLGPPPTGDQKSVEALELNAAKAVAPAVASDDEFSDPIEHVDPSKKGADGKAVKPEDVPAWGKGKLHTPTIHRLRLDGPGAAIHGVSDATGFTVLVPGRKLMEQGSAIIKRDSRIGRARTTNTPGGAQIRITFRETLPSYRVRLRRDYVELLISAPEEAAAKKASAKDDKAASKPAAKAVSSKPAAKR